jgi:hypothetical protein
VFTNNVTAANTFDGFEYWSVSKFPVVNHITAHNGVLQFFQSTSDSASPYFVNSQFVCFNGTSDALSSKRSYVAALDVVGGRIVGCATGIVEGAVNVHLKDLRLQNVINIDYTNVPHVSSAENVVHVPLPGHPLRFVIFGTPDVWSGTLPLPRVGGSLFLPARGSRHTITNWQGTGQNFQLFTQQQEASTAAWPSTNEWPYIFDCPEPGFTMQQCWDRYGLSIGGEPVARAETVPLDGLVNGLARPGLLPRFGPPRAPVTSPTMALPAKINPGDGHPFIYGYGMVTGDPSMASSTILVSIDGAPPFQAGASANDTFQFAIRAISEGLHEIRTWRTDRNQKPIGAPAVFHYVVGPPPSP